jgi:hypothetical protein
MSSEFCNSDVERIEKISASATLTLSPAVSFKLNF